MGNIDYTDFHYLIEIAVNLDKAFEKEKRLSTPKTRGNITIWKGKLKEWVKMNYEDGGILGKNN